MTSTQSEAPTAHPGAAAARRSIRRLDRQAPRLLTRPSGHGLVWSRAAWDREA
jgi:hypothetical protein